MFVLFTLLVKAEANQLSLDERVEYQAGFAEPGSGVLVHLDPGLRLTLRDLATLMMMISDNSALNMVCAIVNLVNLQSSSGNQRTLITRTGYGIFS